VVVSYDTVRDRELAAVVTYLEMTAPPARRPSPERPDLDLAPLPRRDLAGYRDLYRRVGADWLWFSRLLMSDAQLRAILEDPAVEAYALRRDGRSIGLLELDGRQPDEVELAFFGLVPEAVGTGAGRWLMDRAVELAFAKRPRRFWVHTCTLDHPAALPFYVRSGFRPYGRAVEIADDPRLAGALPRDAAPSIPLVE
jgi:GNAT superfamily N-acetyltransferase